jgi:hypothetical protein
MKSLPQGYELYEGKILKKCKEGQKRNPVTKRCRNIKTKSPKIPTGYEVYDGKILKKCKEGQYRNPVTKRCRKGKNDRPQKTSTPKQPKMFVKKTTSPKIKQTAISPKITIKKQTSLKKPNCKRIAIMNERNSCYLDSLMVSLFHHNNDILKRIMLNSSINYSQHKNLKRSAEEILAELKKIQSFINDDRLDKSEQTCKHFRKLLDNYQKEYGRTFPNRNLEDNNWVTRQSEPIQLIQFLNVMFNFPDTTVTHNKKWGSLYTNLTKDKIDSIKKTSTPLRLNEIKSTFIDNIPIDELYGKDKLYIRDYYPVKTVTNEYKGSDAWVVDNMRYKTAIEQIEIMSAPVLFIHINRLIDLGDSLEKLETKIIPESRITMKSGTILKLQSIIIHWGTDAGGHYTCLYKCNHTWYEYDDLQSKSNTIGSLQDVANYKHGTYLKNCTDLVYTMI